MTVQITAAQFHAADGVEDWRCLYHLVSAHFRTVSLANGVTLVDEIGRLVDGPGHQERGPSSRVPSRPGGFDLAAMRVTIAARTIAGVSANRRPVCRFGGTAGVRRSMAGSVDARSLRRQGSGRLRADLRDES
ncbi:hypothetical protein [Micromonospora sp. C81]|uniref:hypothetical protein n=1 Tax=Micromonospora sp. C81 TaxID=2824881 RepID=UPI001B362E44|nr:hypothetical protein [Micromonospora sp. C81]MBQ1038821.1 hypothetical protein [Micromonospora sp. C81]